MTWCPVLGMEVFDIDSIPGSLSLLHTRSTRSSVDLKGRTGPTATSRETPADSLTPKRRSLVSQSRRSVPSLRSPSLQTQSPSATNRSSAPVKGASPNALKRPHPHPGGPDAKRVMPSSVAYSETRSLASGHGRSLNSAPRLSESRAPMDEGRPKNDDIFLNIARTDSGRRDSLGRSDFRRVSRS